jgi:multidrug efflux pump subunit AcrA (membrane-fusion protein)
VEADFDITGRGTLLPSDQRDIFARVDGIADELLVEHGQTVVAGEPLLKLRSPELARIRAELEGERRTTEQQISDLTALRGGRDARNEPRPLNQAELAARQAELSAILESLDQQLAALARHEQELTVRSPIDGNVLTWDVEQLLSGRPVQAGQRLLTIADVDGPWIVEVRVPDRDIGHVHQARQSGAALPVTFLAATDLKTRRSGSIREVAGVVEHDPLDGSVVVVTVDVAPNQDFERRRGATVYPRIHCGRRPLGYVWFRRAYESVAAWLALW